MSGSGEAPERSPVGTVTPSPASHRSKLRGNDASGVARIRAEARESDRRGLNRAAEQFRREFLAKREASPPVLASASASQNLITSLPYFRDYPEISSEGAIREEGHHISEHRTERDGTTLIELVYDNHRPYSRITARQSVAKGSRSCPDHLVRILFRDVIKARLRSKPEARG